MYDNGPDTNARIIVFASAPAIRLLASANTWFIDGIFEMAHRGFMQLYVIRVSLRHTAVSTVYTVLQRKSLSSYMELFQAVIDHCHSMELCIDPTTVLCDFGQGVIKALQNIK